MAQVLRLMHGGVTAGDHQAICLDIIDAYSGLNLVDQVELERAFAGEMSPSAMHQLARRMLANTPPEQLALVLARLIFMSAEGEEAVGGVH